MVPATIASAIALLRETSWGPKALYAVFGWFALVPPSVAAMGIAMVANDDPNASSGEVIVLCLAAVAFAALAIRLYVPLFRPEREPRTPVGGASDRRTRPVAANRAR